MQISPKLSRNNICNSGSPTVQRADLGQVTESGAKSAASRLTTAACTFTMYKYRAKIAQITHTAQEEGGAAGTADWGFDNLLMCAFAACGLQQQA